MRYKRINNKNKSKIETLQYFFIFYLGMYIKNKKF